MADEKKDERAKLFKIRDINGGETITKTFRGIEFTLKSAEEGKVFMVEVVKEMEGRRWTARKEYESGG